MHELSVTFTNREITVRRADGVTLASACGDSETAFSATQLLAASLGSCIAASLAPLLSRHDVDDSRLRIALHPQGRAIEDGFAVTVFLPPCDDALRTRCRRAADACPVRRALHVPIDIHWQEDECAP